MLWILALVALCVVGGERPGAAQGAASDGLAVSGRGTVGEVEAAVDPSQPLERIAFGSCAKQDQPQPIWDAIVDTQPQLFLFLGDNIYGDTRK